MEKISEEVWKEILNKQKFPLIGTNKPNNGNGYHDGLSWQIPFRYSVFKDNNDFNTFRSIYLRDLSNDVRSDFQWNKKFVDVLNITKCSENYKNTFKKYISGKDYYRNEFLYVLREWAQYFAYKGRLIIEIIGWYDNNANQFYGFELRRLDTDYCKVTKKNIIYNAPIDQKGDNLIFKEVTIPKEKCIIINFPDEFGGYKGFVQKDKQILKLGDKLKFETIQKNYEGMIEWDKKYHKIISNWGTSAFTHIDDVSEFYKELNIFKYRYLVICCIHEIINGLRQLINYLNKKLLENAEVEFNLKEYDKDYFKSMQNKFVNGEIDFKEANDFLKFY